jgi:hypothetical protein
MNLITCDLVIIITREIYTLEKISFRFNTNINNDERDLPATIPTQQLPERVRRIRVGGRTVRPDPTDGFSSKAGTTVPYPVAIQAGTFR